MIRAALACLLIALVACACQPPCANDEDCPSDQFCERPAGDCRGDGTCTEVESDIGCFPASTEELTVCGCDGVTYATDCFRREAATSKRSDGPCG